MAYHRPVMIKEVVESLRCRSGGIYVDGTLGGGGHAYEILRNSAPAGVLIGIDHDEEAIREAERRLQEFGPRKILIKGNFADLGLILADLKFSYADGIILDLGVSSHQLDEAERGFSFAREAPLDMRMDMDRDLSAAALVNEWPESELARIIWDYGEEKMARRIARAIARQRSQAPILTTSSLADLVCRVMPEAPWRRLHPATKTFQAIRIAVNDELANLAQAIKSGTAALASGGSFSIVSYHSLEDRIVKNEFRAGEGGCTCPPRLPVCVCKQRPVLRVLTKKPLRPSREEVDANPRARSARLRTAEKI